MKSKSGAPIPDWLESRVKIQAFGQEILRPGNGAISIEEVWEFIHWLTKLAHSTDPIGPFQTIHEPLVRVEAEPSAGPIFEVTTLLSAYGTAKGFYVESSGVAVRFPTDEKSILAFAEALEAELKTITA
ncbi:MAG TPA: hypothetical protein VE177_04360 [Candidatus Binatus sp.]|nr:hypothetical protein [Candidatus Binatus sp.]